MRNAGLFTSILLSVLSAGCISPAEPQGQPLTVRTAVTWNGVAENKAILSHFNKAELYYRGWQGCGPVFVTRIWVHPGEFVLDHRGFCIGKEIHVAEKSVWVFTHELHHVYTGRRKHDPSFWVANRIGKRLWDGR